MAGYKITTENGLITTTLHGMNQDAFVVTEDRVTTFNNYSLEFQSYLALFSTVLGFFLSKINEPKSVGFIVSAILGIILFLFLCRYYSKFKKVRDGLFTKATIETAIARKG